MVTAVIQYILSRKVQLNSWQALIKPWDGFCGPLEVRTHPLPPPDSGASFSRFGCFVFDLGCFVFEIWMLRASVFVFESSFSKLPVSKDFILYNGLNEPIQE